MNTIPNEIMQEFLTLECALSPENLTGDGEFSREYVRKREAELMRKWAALEARVGRKVSTTEVYNWAADL